MAKSDKAVPQTPQQRQAELVEDMADMFKRSPQTPQQRQAAFKARQLADGYVMMNVWVKAKTHDKVTQYAVEFKCGMGEVIDDLVSKLP